GPRRRAGHRRGGRQRRPLRGGFRRGTGRRLAGRPGGGVRLHSNPGVGLALPDGAVHRRVLGGAPGGPAVIRKSTRRIAVLLAVSDVAATWVALATAYFLRFRAEIVPITKGIPDASSYYRLCPLIAGLWPAVYYFYGLYQVRRNRSRVEEGLSVLVATGLATLLLSGLATFYSGFSYSRLVLILFLGLDVL